MDDEKDDRSHGDKDHGPGNEEMFPAADLERLYRKGGLDGSARIKGNQLNEVLGVTRYVNGAWYLVTEKGVKRL